MKRTLFVVGSLVGMLAMADYDYLKRGYNPGSRSEVESIIRSSLGSDTSRADAIRKQIDELSNTITKNREEKKERKLLLEKVGTNETLSLLNSLPNALLKKRIDDKRAENEEIAKRANGLNRQSAVNPADLNNGLIEENCRAGVDLSAGKLSADETSKFNYFKSEVSKFVDRDDEKLEKAADEAAQKAEEALQKALSGEKKYDDNKDAQVAYLSDEARISGLKKANKKEDEKTKWWIGSIVKSIGGARKKLRELNKSDRKMAELAGFAADDMLSKVTRVRQEQVDIAIRLRDKCLKEADRLGRNNPIGQNTLFNSAFEAMRLWNASYATGGFLTMIQSVSSRLSCPDVSTDVQTNWDAVISAAEAARGATDPRTLLTSLSAVGDAAIAAQSQMGSRLSPLIDKLNYACRNRQNVEKLVATLSSQTNSQNNGQPSTGQGQSRTGATPTRIGVSTSPTHNLLGKK